MKVKKPAGFTLIEVIMVSVAFTLLLVTTVYFFRAILLTWSGQEIRAGFNTNLDRGLEDLSRELREAREVQSTAGYDEIRLTQGTSSTTSSIYYLYHASDTYGPPPSFNQSSYQLRKATLTGGINGTFTYGAGDVILNDVVPPPTSDLSLSSNLLTLDLTVQRGDETTRSRTQIRPRNV